MDRLFRLLKSLFFLWAILVCLMLIAQAENLTVIMLFLQPFLPKNSVSSYSGITSLISICSSMAFIMSAASRLLWEEFRFKLGILIYGMFFLFLLSDQQEAYIKHAFKGCPSRSISGVVTSILEAAKIEGTLYQARAKERCEMVTLWNTRQKDTPLIPIFVMPAQAFSTHAPAYWALQIASQIPGFQITYQERNHTAKFDESKPLTSLIDLYVDHEDALYAIGINSLVKRLQMVNGQPAAPSNHLLPQNLDSFEQ